jgi:hypothetical protein
MYITPLTMMPGPRMLIVDSPHSYFSYGNGNFYSTISIPGAATAKVSGERIFISCCCRSSKQPRLGSDLQGGCE